MEGAPTLGRTDSAARRRTWALLAAACVAGAGCGAGTAVSSTTTATTSPAASVVSTTVTVPAPTTTTLPPTTTTTLPLSSPCAIEPPSPEFDTDFYAKQCTVLGIPVVSSAAVVDAAHHRAEAVIVGMMSKRPDLVEKMVGNGLRVGIIGEFEVTTDLPEYSDLQRLFPETEWDTRTRGVGATLFIPMSSVGEENLLCLGSDVYRGESIMVHEFAHSVRSLGIATADGEVDLRIADAYEAAIGAGLWADTYAATNSEEYWAEAVQSYFDANVAATPPNGIHNDIDTNVELAEYDPRVYGIIESVFGGTGWRYTCS